MNPLKIIKYGKYFSESRFLAFATRYGKKLAFVQKAVVLFLCLRDQDTIAGLGWVDDVAVLGIAFKIANRYIKTSHEEQAKKLFPFGN